MSENYTAIIETRNKKVKKANALIQKSKFNLDLRQQKLIIFLISQIKQNDKDFQDYRFSISEFCKVVGVEYHGRYDEIKDTIQKIADKSMWIKIEGVDKLIRWIEKAEIDNNTKEVIIRFDKDLKPFLLELKENYFTYKALYPLFFRHKYSIRLYEWAKSILYHEDEILEYIVKTEDIIRIMGAETYKDYYAFKTRALKPALKEVNSSSDLNVECSEHKSAKGKIDCLYFTVRKKPALEVMKTERQITQGLSSYLGQLTFIELD